MTTPSLSERGAALPLAILWSMLLTVGLVSGLSRLSAERRTQANRDGEAEAYALARTGMDRYLETVAGQPGASLDTTITGLPGGSVTISVRRLRQGTSTVRALYLVRAHATHTGAQRFDAQMGSAARSVTRFATWQPGSMSVNAAWTSITGLTKNGGSGTLSGNDACSPAAAAVAGVAVPVTAQGGGTGYSQNGGSSVPAGSPAIGYLGADPATAADSVHIDWDGIINGGALTPQYSLTGTTGWPSNFSNWPTIYVNNPSASVGLGPGHSGQGLLVIRGDASVSGSFSWNGVILVGGVLTSNGNNTVLGAVVTGLNVKLGLTVGSSDVGNGNKTFRYSSCNVASAIAGLGGLVAMKNTFGDNWPVY